MQGIIQQGKCLDQFRGVFSYTEEDKQIVFGIFKRRKIKVDTSMHCVKRSMLLCEKIYGISLCIYPIVSVIMITR